MTLMRDKGWEKCYGSKKSYLLDELNIIVNFLKYTQPLHALARTHTDKVYF